MAVETRQHRQIALEKVIGGVFAVFGVGAFVLGLIGLIGWAVK